MISMIQVVETANAFLCIDTEKLKLVTVTAVVCVDFVTDCEIDFAKVTLKGKKELYIGSFYMPKRNMKDLCELKKIFRTFEWTLWGL